MKRLLALSAFLFSVTPAFASHPHDRVCVASAKVAGQSPVDLIFQWELARNYDHGGPNEDSHSVTVQARSCYGDDESAICSDVKPETVTVAPGKDLKMPLKLKDGKGEVFFEGTFDAQQERLIGKLNRGPGKPDSVKDSLAKVNIKLNCVSQPQVNLGVAEEKTDK